MVRYDRDIFFANFIYILVLILSWLQPASSGADSDNRSDGMAQGMQLIVQSKA